jgi:hypothetical protein
MIGGDMAKQASKRKPDTLGQGQLVKPIMASRLAAISLYLSEFI